MLERERLESKKISKTNAVTSIMDHELPADDVYIGPSDYVPWLTDRKWAHIRVEGQAFGDVPLNVEMKLEVWDSPNSAGIVTDAVRCCKLALNHGIGGPLEAPSSYLMKSPPVQVPDSVARDNTEEFIAEYGGAPKLPGQGQDQGRQSWPGPERRLSVSLVLGPAAHSAGQSRTVDAAPMSLGRRVASSSALGPPSASRSPRSRRTPGSCTTRSTVTWSGCPTSSVAAVTASWWSRRPTRASWCARRARVKARGIRPGRRVRRGRVRELSASVRAFPFRRGRLGVAAARRLAHDRGPARGRAVRLRARARAVRAERAASARCGTRGAERGHVPLRRPSASCPPRWRARWWSGCSGASTAAPPPSRATRDLMRALLPRPLRGDPPGADLARRRSTRRGRVEILFSMEEERGALRIFLRALRKLPAELPGRPPCGARPERRSPRPRRCPARSATACASPGPPTARRPQHLAAPGSRGGVDGRRAGAPAVLRALAAGAVPVASRLPQYEEALEDGDLGLLFEPRDAVTLAAQLARLVARPSVAVRASPSARPRRGRDSAGSRTADGFEALYATLAARRHPPTGNAAVRKRLRGVTSSTSTCTCTPTTRPTARPGRTRC